MGLHKRTYTERGTPRPLGDDIASHMRRVVNETVEKKVRKEVGDARKA